MTTAGDEHPVEFERLMRTDTVDFVQLSYSIDDRRAADRLLPLAADRGMAVLVNSGARPRQPISRDRRSAATGMGCGVRLHELEPVPTEVRDLAPGLVTCAIPGMRQARHVEDNMAAVRGRLPDTAMRRRMEQHFDSIL